MGIPIGSNGALSSQHLTMAISFMFPGDVEIPAEFDLLSYGGGIRTTVLKVPHHGSHSSSSRPFIDKVRPEGAVFSCGRNNEYGFPVFEIVRRYEEAGSRIYRTDRHGDIEIITDGKDYKVETKRCEEKTNDR